MSIYSYFPGPIRFRQNMVKRQLTQLIKGYFFPSKKSLVHAPAETIDLRRPGLDDRHISDQHANEKKDILSGLQKGATVGRYQILRKLGQGAAGCVYLGRDPYIKRPVAIKLSQPSSENARERFFVEAQSAGSLNHPNIVALYDAGIHQNYCYMAMEYIEGPTLEDFCNVNNLLPINKVVEIIFKVCIALDYAHKKGVIHKDIKPSNIILDKNGIAKLTDFGIAQLAEHTVEMGFFGTPSYMSPEQLKDTVVGSESDVFSLGCVLYELLTGIQAFSGDKIFSVMYKIANKEPEPICKLRPNSPILLEQITKKSMSKNIKDRYQNCMEFAYDLRVAFRGLSSAQGKIKDADGLVHSIPFFNDFNGDQVKELISAGSVIKVGRGKVIVTEGEIDDTFFIILSGRAKVIKQAVTIAHINIGQCFGEMSFIGGQARTASVIAETECILIKIGATLLDKSSPAIQLLFYKNFAKTLVSRLSANTTSSTGLE